MSEQKLHATTIIGVYKNDCAAIAGDGQVTFNNATIMKQTAKKVRRLYHGQVIAGFAGSVADAFTLFDKFEIKLEESRGNLHKAAVALAREWRTDKVLRTLEAMLIAASKESLLIISGGGEVIEPDNGIAAIGSGGMYALAAARALSAHTDMTTAEIASEALSVAADICIYTNSNIHMETIS